MNGHYWIARIEVTSTFPRRRWIEEHEVWIDGDPAHARDTAIALAARRANGDVESVKSCKKRETP